MIKRTVLIIFSCLIFCNPSMIACDACGCSASGMGMGLLTNYRSNFIRLSYLDTRFKTNSEDGSFGSDKFTQFDLSFRYSLGKTKRIRLMGHLPYKINNRSNENENLSEHGLSDIRLVANYVLLNNLPIGKKSMLYLEAGGGLTLPTGKYDDQIHDRNLPENFNIGKGAIGYIFQTNAVLNTGKNGLVFSNNYQWNSATKSGYQFGNQFTSQLTAFREVQLKNLKLIPNVGFGYEAISTDKYANENEVSETGGRAVFFSSALNIKTKKCLTGFSYSMPLEQNYSQGAVTARGRIACHVAYIF